jgi:hypothetical protein
MSTEDSFWTGTPLDKYQSKLDNQAAKEFEKEEEARRRNRLRVKADDKKRAKARDSLKTPQVIRQLSRLLGSKQYADSEWQLHKRAAGMLQAPAKAPKRTTPPTTGFDPERWRNHSRWGLYDR